MARVLVVDDEPEVLDTLVEALRLDGHEVDTAREGGEALEKHRVHPADVIVTDIVMPDRNGIDVMLALKREAPGTRVIAISGGGGISGHYDYLEIARLIGAKAVLQKPFSLQELRQTVLSVLAAD